jgi:predicted ribosome quality control (RQC) complex YloA/Tae2 family protein
MPLDGIFLHHLTTELQKCVGCRADKIHQPSKDELVLLLRSASFTGKLLVSVRSGSARLHITNSAYDNPAEPPAFCKLLRKHLSSAKITEIVQDGLDRTVFIKFMSYNEMGDTVYPTLAVELITGKANIVLINNEGRILDALHRSDIENAKRLLLPGAKYAPPQKENKLNPITASALELKEAVMSASLPLNRAFTSTIEGVSPLISRELAAKTAPDGDRLSNSLNCEEEAALISALKEFKAFISSPRPCILKDPSANSKDFSYMPITQYAGTMESHTAEGFSQILEEFYGDKDRAARIKGMAQDIYKLLTNIKNRTQRKLAYRLADLEKCQNREQYRIYGELIKANIYKVEKGAKTAWVQNYYDPNMEYIQIPLDPALSPAANAAKYFKEYKKTYTAQQTLSQLVAKDEKELLYIDSVLLSLERAQSAAELSEIREELCDAGYLFRNPKAKQKVLAGKPKEYISKSGFKILVGRNNRENDMLTTKIASKQDLWFHTKNIPGSHVILITQGKEVDEETLLYAASLAASHSKAAMGENVPVDYTLVKNVKKPSGAKPGMVIYLENKTIYAKPT